MYDYSAMASNALNQISNTVDNATMMVSKKNAQKRAHEYNIEMQDRANDINIANWEKQNAYNSPANSMKLYEEAGLNKNLIYGQGQVDQAEIPRYQAPQQDTGKPASYEPPGNSMLKNYMQFNALKAQTDNVKAQTITQTQMAKNAVWDGLNKRLDANYKGAAYPLQLGETQADIRRIDAQSGNIGKQTAGQIIKNQMLQKEKEYMDKHNRKMPSSTYDNILQELKEKAEGYLQMPEIKYRKGKDLFGNPTKEDKSYRP